MAKKPTKTSGPKSMGRTAVRTRSTTKPQRTTKPKRGVKRTDAATNGAASATESGFVPLQRLSRDLRDAAQLLDRREVRYLVDSYYAIQDFRIQAAAQVRSAEAGEPNRVVGWLGESMRRLEASCKTALGHFAKAYTVGQWMQGITGIGPVISAGFLAHLDIRPRHNAQGNGEAFRPHAGNFWSFAGLDPHAVWGKGQKRPWNAKLKTLCWKLGESFVKVQNNRNDFYGKVYARVRAAEEQQNARGAFSQQAAEKLERFKIGKTTEAYKWYSDGKLPPAHLYARAKRYAVKLFVSHLHQVMWEDYYDDPVPEPYAWRLEGHGEREGSKIEPPGWPGEFEGKSLVEMFA